MITVTELGLSFGSDTLFKGANLLFTAGNCYGVIGANGAGKSTFLRILSGELEPTTGTVSYDPKLRMSVLKQDHFAFDDYGVSDTVIMGNKRLYEIMTEKDALYLKEDFSDEDGERASVLEGEFAELGGWEAESDAAKLLRGLGLDDSIMSEQMSSLGGNDKVKILLAQALFGKPDIILLDEPTNHLDIDSVAWLEDFLAEYFGTVIVVSHDRHFLNNVCTHIVDIDYGRIKMYIGNYEFWYESSQLVQRLLKQQNKRAEDKIKELEAFIRRFSANKSKSRQATSRKKLIEKITPDEMPSSSRKYPFIGFEQEREAGKDILEVNSLSKEIDGVNVLKNLTFTVNRGDKIAFVAPTEIHATTLFKIISDEMKQDSGTFKWGQTISVSYFPLDSNSFFENCDLNIIDWVKQYSKDETETYLRGFLGRMLFSGDEVYKSVKVLSGGEKVRCMFSRMMLYSSNLLILDHPTNHLDLESITAVNNGIRDFKGTVLFTSHDREIVGTAANRIIELTEDGCLDYSGNYEEYLEWRKSQELGSVIL
ncbi:MAG: ATP-binding cassette domain-containing protein [Oscillospiraceae bacterium]|jgi:ATPase subunit of ABC transporter with duplicated ATPase domains|nr:ATP-binding cassette domain-containing protein [Oscillospiraceae bacterium]